MEGEFVEKIHGKHSIYIITRKKGGVFSSDSYWVYKDGKFWKSKDTLSEAVNMCE